MENLLFSLNAVLPIFLVVAFGYHLRKSEFIKEDFLNDANKLVFKILLPLMLFRDVSQSTYSDFSLGLVTFATLFAFCSFLLLWLTVGIFTKEKTLQSSFVQGAFRGNYAIIGLPLTTNLFGVPGAAKAALLLSFSVPLYNVLATIILTVNSPNHKGKINFVKLLREIAVNPLIIGVLSGILYKIIKPHLPIPLVFMNTISSLISLTTPLALICVGASFSFKAAFENLNLAIISSIFKIIISPTAGVFIAYFIGFRGIDLGILFILFGAPTAVSSYIMGRAMNANSDLAANILLLTTIFSSLTTFIGIYILKSAGVLMTS